MAAFSKHSNSWSGNTGTTHRGFDILLVSDCSLLTGKEAISSSGDLKKYLKTN
jgi:hypothetical protein